MPRAKCGFAYKNKEFSYWSSDIQSAQDQKNDDNDMIVSFLGTCLQGSGRISLWEWSWVCMWVCWGLWEWEGHWDWLLDGILHLPWIMQMTSHTALLNPRSFKSSFLETNLSRELSPRFVPCKEASSVRKSLWQLSNHRAYTFCVCGTTESVKHDVLGMGRLLLFITGWCHCFLRILLTLNPVLCATQRLVLHTLSHLSPPQDMSVPGL